MFDPKIFRSNAIHYYEDRQRDGVPAPLRIAPAGSWWVFWVVGATLGLALVLATFFKVEMRSTGRGILIVGTGARPLVTPLAGRVSQVHVARGQRVQSGDLLLELEAAQIQSDLLQADRALSDLNAFIQPTQRRLDQLAHSQLRDTQARLEAQRQQIASLEASVALFQRKAKANEELERNGLVSPLTVAEAKEALAQALRSVNSAHQSLMATKAELASLTARRDSEAMQNLREAQNLRTRREALAFTLGQTRIVAPGAGIVEGLHVRPGDPVVSGQNLGRILTGTSSPRAFALLAEKDRAYVKAGDSVRLEVDQYPPAEWGALKGTIGRIGTSIATPSELRELFGETFKSESPAYLVELDIPSGQSRPMAQHPLESGMGLKVQFTLRRQRPIAFLLEPLRRWLE